MVLLAVFIGGGIGSTLRFLVYVLASKLSWHSSLSTIIVNCIGCFLIAYAYSKLGNYFESYKNLQPFLVTGFLGGFTTFSTFILDFQQINSWQNYIYLAASIILGILFFKLGLVISKV